MESSNSAIINGNWTDGTQPTQGKLYWWLGEARFSNVVWCVLGYDYGLDYVEYAPACCGVRPVLVVSES